MVPPGNALQITQALALAEDSAHRDKQLVPGRNADAAPHPGIGDRREKADQVEICCGRNALGH